MEFEDVSEEVEWEAQRVAAAFGVATLELVGERAPEGITDAFIYGGNSNFGSDTFTEALIHVETAALLTVKIIVGNNESVCEVCFDEFPWPAVYPSREGASDGFMVRSLYRLGIEDEEWIATLNSPLSAHEKLELRLSMPREFWPKTWLEEGH